MHIYTRSNIQQKLYQKTKLFYLVLHTSNLWQLCKFLYTNVLFIKTISKLNISNYHITKITKYSIKYILYSYLSIYLSIYLDMLIILASIPTKSYRAITWYTITPRVTGSCPTLRVPASRNTATTWNNSEIE